MALISSLSMPTAEMEIWVVRRNTRVTLSFDEFPWVNSVQIQLNMGSLPSISIGIQAPYEEGIELLNSDLFAPYNVVRVKVGYHDTIDSSPWYHGLLSQGGNGLSLSANGLTGSITAIPASASMVSKPQGRAGESESSTPELTVEEIIQTLIRKTEDLTGAEFLGESKSILSGVRIPFQFGGNRSYFDLIKSLLDRLDCAFWIAPDPDAQGGSSLRIIDRASQHTDQWHRESGRKIFALRQGLNPSREIYPIISFNPPQGVTPWLAQGAIPNPGARHTRAATITPAGEIKVADNRRDRTSSQPEDRSTAEKDPDGNPIETPRPEYEAGQLQYTQMPSVPNENAQLQAEADALHGRSKLVEGLVAEVTSIGVPDLFIGEAVGISGCSTRFNGIYVVEAATHAYSPGQYDLSMTLRSQPREGNTPGSTGAPNPGNFDAVDTLEG